MLSIFLLKIVYDDVISTAVATGVLGSGSGSGTASPALRGAVA